MATNSNQTDVPITNGFTEENGMREKQKNDIKDDNFAGSKDIMMLVNRFHIGFKECIDHNLCVSHWVFAVSLSNYKIKGILVY